MNAWTCEEPSIVRGEGNISVDRIVACYLYTAAEVQAGFRILGREPKNDTVTQMIVEQQAWFNRQFELSDGFGPH